MGFLGVFLLLDHYDKSEQLARSFAALYNIIVITSLGIRSGSLSATGAWMARRARARGDFRLAKWAIVFSGLGMCLALVILVFCLTPAVRRTF